MKRVLAAITLILMFGVCHAEDGRPDKGWFFYETDPEPKKPSPTPEKKPQVQAQPEASQPEKKPMTVAWMRKMIPIMQERAYDNPTKENVAAYAYLIRTLGDKMQRYTDVHMELIKTDPFLDMNNSMPFNGTQRDEVMNGAKEVKRKALSLLAQKSAGLFVFFDSKCSFCKTQISIVNNVAKHYKFDVMFISVDGKGLPGATGWVKDNGHAKMLGIKRYPTTVLAIPPKTYVPISFGLMAEDQLESTLLTAAKLANLIPADMVKDIDPFTRGVLTLDDMKDGAYDDPDKFVDYVKSKLDDRY
ncbi:MAG: conjugal transfer protein TraF [Sideroxydans sp.]|nr:conjugal transfer protein TraF [Sideroxydans sp.]MDD5056617.1 conjugal transfer protein TraF [Sideroxydans sp.]